MLRGVIYYGGAHFMARWISNSSVVWFHDGMANGKMLLQDRQLASTKNWKKCQGKIRITAVYVRMGT